MSQKPFHSVSCLYYKLYFVGGEKSLVICGFSRRDAVCGKA